MTAPSLIFCLALTAMSSRAHAASDGNFQTIIGTALYTYGFWANLCATPAPAARPSLYSNEVSEVVQITVKEIDYMKKAQTGYELVIDLQALLR